MPSVDEIRDRMQQWDEAAWCLAALARCLDDAHDDDAHDDDAHDDAAADVLAALGLPGVREAAGPTARQLANQAKAPLLQLAAVLSGKTAAWSEQPDEALIAQGTASGQAAGMFARFALPQLDGLAERLDADGAAMLDVGTGIGALAVAYAEQFPRLRVVGLDVMPRVLALAARTVAASPAADRVELRRQSVAELPDEDAFDLAWVPAPFVPEAPLRDGVRRIRTALRPGGWIMLGHAKFGDDPLENALNRFKTIAFGGTPLDTAAATTLLQQAGFDRILSMTTPPGAPALTFGRA
jgi:hypothetical protein